MGNYTEPPRTMVKLLSAMANSQANSQDRLTEDLSLSELRNEQLI